jgi:superfamily II DNA or RNA helicase
VNIVFTFDNFLIYRKEVVMQVDRPTPYPYQRIAVKAAVYALNTMMRALVVMATGLGKTFTAAFIAKEVQAKKILFLVHNNFILKHALGEFRQVFGQETKMAICNGMSQHGVHEADIVFATWQTMSKKLKQWKRNHFDLVIVDEAHHSEADTYRPVMEYFTGPKLGITATPDRSDGADICDTFGPAVVNITLEEAIAQNWLPRIEYHVVTDESLDEHALQRIAAEIREGKKRFTMAEVNRRIFIKKRDKEIARIINGYNEKAVVFCANIPHANRMARSLDLGTTFHSKKGKSQSDSWDKNQQALDDLKNGVVRRVTAINAFNEGVNVPSVGLVAFCRVTGSLTIFRQQLGRGLRPGKDKLIVLDFVGNLERIQLVQEMMNKVADHHERLISKEERDREGYNRKPFEVSGAGFEFTFSNSIVDLMKVLEKVGRSYSKEELVLQLKKESEKLGRVPHAKDLSRASREGRTADMTTFVSAFGSWNGAILAAGFKRNKRYDFTKEELIQQLKNESKKIGKTPSANDLNRASKEKRTASITVFKRVFGSLENAWKLGGLEPLSIDRPTRKDLIQQLKAEAKLLNRTPTQADIAEASKAGRIASQSAFYKEFKSLGKAQEAAGLLVNYRTYTDKVLFELLRESTKRLRRLPTAKDLGKNGLPSATVFQKRFGGLHNALLAFGILK